LPRFRIAGRSPSGRARAIATVTVRTRAPRRAGRSDWLPLGAAARLVGVDPDTLRRWADEGRIDAFTTPGGHRRFHRRALESLTARRRAAPASLRALGATPERLVAAYRRAYRSGVGRLPRPADAGRLEGTGSERVAPGAARDAVALGGLTPATRAAFRADGQRLVAALVAALDGEPEEREGRERVAAECCDRMARRLADDGRSLGEAIAAFVLARRPFLAEIARLGARRALDPARLARLYDDATALLDRLLLRFVAAHETANADRVRPSPAPSSPDPSL
jgi:excisionase family DNA binding protein